MSAVSLSAKPHRLRILMVAPTSFFADYGCHVRILEEVRALQARGHSVRVCTYHNGDNVPDVEIRRSVDVPWLKRAEVGSSRHKAYLDVALFIETLRQTRSFQPDVIHAHLHEGALIGSVVGRMTRTPVIFDYQGSLTEEMLDHGFIRRTGRRERFFRWLERRIDRMPARVIPSSIAAMTYLARSGLPADHVTLISDGVDTDRFDPARLQDDRFTVRQRLGIPQDAPVIMYLGLLAEYQGTSLLINAARQVLSRRPDIYFIIAGYPGADHYALMAHDMPVDGHVLFPGRVAYATAPAHLASGDVSVAPKLSTTEGNGKLLNYMAIGCPVVATDTPTNRAILGNTGRLFPPGDTSALASEIELALTAHDDERRALRQRVQSEFDWSARVIELEHVYAEVLGRAEARLAMPAEPVATSSD
jgi:glycosyltransferase involved in cell wall biosynthesis